MNELTQIDLMNEMHYSPDSGLFTQVGSNHIRPYGSVVGFHNAQGYLACKIKARGFVLHRLAFLYMTGELPSSGLEVDHINGIRDDNRWCNLRLATREQNQHNVKTRKDNTTGIKGITLSLRKGKRRYDACIRFNGVSYSKSRTNLWSNPADDKKILTELVEWLDEMRIKFHGEFANDGLGSSLLPEVHVFETGTKRGDGGFGSTSEDSSEIIEENTKCQQ